MGLLRKLFGNKEQPAAEAAPDTEAAGESETTTEISSRNAPRREVVQVVLRDTMRRHGIPSDWIECRILSVTSASRGAGLHLLLVVRDGTDRLATYVHAFQDAFMADLVKLEPKAVDWVFSISWQFEGHPTQGHAPMPDPSTWRGDKAGAAAASASAASSESPASSAPAPEDEDEELRTDLAALYAIRDAVLRQPADAAHPEFEETRPGATEEDEEQDGGSRR